jgi:heme/copper-type cytochrome/quinol oxidase subunit 2
MPDGDALAHLIYRQKRAKCPGLVCYFCLIFLQTGRGVGAGELDTHSRFGELEDVMFWMVVYLLVSYLSVALLLTIVLVCMRRRAVPQEYRETSPAAKAAQGAITILVLSLPLVPYARVELNTRLALPALQPAVEEAALALTGNRHVRSVKGLSLEGSDARVHIVSPCSMEYPTPQKGWTADVVTLVHEGSGWRYNGYYDTVWSDCGSASGNIFPPYPSKGEVR